MTLLGLPLEVLTQIINILETVDLLNLRLVCSSLRHVSLHEFGTRCFGRRRFMILPLSLEALLKIAENKPLSPYLHTLIVGIDYLAEDVLKDSTWEPYFESQQRRAAYQRYVEEQNALRASGHATAILTKALRKLRNCQRVCIHAQEDECDANLAMVPYQRSYGATTIREDTGIWPSMSTQGIEARDLIGLSCQIVLDAIATSGIVLHSFETDFNNVQSCQRMPVTTFCIPSKRLNCFDTFTTNLRRLKLHTSLVLEGAGLPYNWVEWSMSFILRFVNLEELDFTAEAVGDSARLMEELASMAMRKSIFPKLRRLGLQNFVTTANHINRFLGGCLALQALSLREVSLYEGSWVEVLQYILGSSIKLSEFEFQYNSARVLYKGTETHKHFLMKNQDLSATQSPLIPWCALGEDKVRELLQTMFKNHYLG